jgi:hypothetical protein
MLALGVARILTRPPVRAGLTRLSAVLVLLFGAITVARALDVLPHGAHHHVEAPVATRYVDSIGIKTVR